MFAGATAIFALVMALLWAAFRGALRWTAADETRAERIFLVGFGLAFPAAVLVALLGYGLVIGERLLPWPGPDVVSVGAEARRWQWRFTYDDRPGFVTEGVLHLPAGRPVDVAITSVDVVHSFWVPRLAGKLDAVPGHVNVLRLSADRPRLYAGLGAEFSGEGYSGFRFSVRAHDAEGWAAFLAGELP